MTEMRKKLAEYYLDYVNNYLTIEVYAEHNGLSIEQARALIKLGEDIHETNVSGEYQEY